MPWPASIFGRLFSSDGFVPRRVRGLWPDWLVWEYVVGNALTWLAYVAMPILIWQLGRRRPELSQFTGLVCAFGGFIGLCGLGHFLDMIAFFRPMYRFSGHVLIATGLASWWTAWSLRQAWPAIIAMRSPIQLESEIAERTEELARVNEELRGQGARFRQLADAMPQIVWASRPDGHLDYYNERWYEYTGFPGEGSGDQSWTPILHPDDVQECMAAWYHAVATGEPYQIEYRFKDRRNGGYRWHLGRGLPVRGKEGAIVRWFGTCTDIDDRKRAEEALRRARAELEDRVRERTAELERANAALIAEVAERSRAEGEALRSREQAEEATRAKSQFLANMSHEIRTPMNAIVGMTELTLGHELDPSSRENLEAVRISADALLELIDDILDFSKIEAGRLDLDPVPFRPREVLDAAVATLLFRASEKSLGLWAVVDPDVPEELVGDPHRLRQILLNLLGNAVKFTARGRVRVRVSAEGPGDAPRILRFSVSDEGIGIPSDRLAIIFDPFSQADGSTTRRFGGTGLGLSISSRLVALMGGRIWVESEVGRGSTFHFTAAFEATPGHLAAGSRPVVGSPPETRRPRTDPGRRLRILLVDDQPLNRRVGMLLLERLGHDVATAQDGPDAIEKHGHGGRFDLILMDIQMPGMDGYEATARIRAIDDRRGRRTPIVALTAYAMKGDRERCLAAGMDDHLAKPIRGDELARVIGAVATVEPAPTEAANPWGLDPDDVRSAFPMDPAVMAEVVEMFRTACVNYVARMRESIEEGDPTRLGAAAHGLMGSLGMFAAEATVGLAAELVSRGTSGDIAGADATLSRLEGAIAGLKPTLDVLADPATCGTPMIAIPGLAALS